VTCGRHTVRGVKARISARAKLFSIAKVRGECDKKETRECLQYE
jgi:hypothetical protein